MNKLLLVGFLLVVLVAIISAKDKAAKDGDKPAGKENPNSLGKMQREQRKLDREYKKQKDVVRKMKEMVGKKFDKVIYKTVDGPGKENLERLQKRLLEAYEEYEAAEQAREDIGQ